MGCKGRVFDVSSNEMYNKDGAYHLFVNCDASVALAKMKFDKEFLDPSQNHWSKDLNEEEFTRSMTSLITIVVIQPGSLPMIIRVCATGGRRFGDALIICMSGNTLGGHPIPISFHVTPGENH